MKKVILAILALNGFQFSTAQTLTYSNYSQALSNTLSVNVADNSSFNATLTTITGTGITWDASGLTPMNGYPVLHLSFNNTAGTPYASLYTNSNYAEYDPALTSVLGYTFYGISQDSIVEWGSYEPSGQHEIFQNPDKHLIFPFSYGQSFTDDYYKTNYSDATTISSYQNGTRTVSFNGFGSLILPQGTFTNVALITETRTNNLGPVSYVYTWYDINNGRKLLLRSENGSSITTAWCTDAVTGTEENAVSTPFSIYPNPASDYLMIEIHQKEKIKNAEVKIYSLTGTLITVMNITQNKTSISTTGFIPGIYFLQLTTGANSIVSKKIIVE